MTAAITELGRRDPAFATIVERFGPPPAWRRDPGFATLLRIVLEQQVSLASAQAAFDRLAAVVEPLTPYGFLLLDDAGLLAIGFSRQKTRYARALATAVLDGSLDLDALVGLDDEQVDAALRTIPGIGPWTATIYRLMALGRPDAWPVHDIALAQAVAELWHLPARPSPEQMLAIAEAWRPWRADAARLLWHYYLSTPRRPGR
ncbi:DNA-3-methyladenine glycosylase family protein [Actinoplanes auranticolor]|uniref:DNA-3-methyladenine glycosylase II n=1 Tax=Actinoplanes auranticolor TaxID=47988 RepID=A0A919VI13_9ACTN|nr:DNA-3-methyladenine glycosylase 2 family protein [Actinoplanes auranticolor]GIM62917.1 DNA-3-methyladenine glycosylase II [Actinoplanes auranticolor]